MLTATLPATARDKLRAHFLSLPADDRRMRFGGTMSDAAVAAYVERLDFDRDTIFGVYGDDLDLAGAAHLSVGDTAAELGVSVAPRHRRRGIGSTLVSRAALHARNHGVQVLFMHCLSDNRAILRIASRLGMQVVRDGVESEAHLALDPATAASIAGELFEEGVALCDHSLRTHFLAARRLVERAGIVAPRPAERERADEALHD